MNSDLPRLPCDSLAEELSHLVLGELPDERRPALEQHLAQCAACRAERDLLVRSIELVKHDGGAAPILELSQARRDRLLADAAAAPRSVVRGPWWTAPRFAAAAALFLGAAFTGSWLWQRIEDRATRIEGRATGIEPGTVLAFRIPTVPDSAPLPVPGVRFSPSAPGHDEAAVRRELEKSDALAALRGMVIDEDVQAPAANHSVVAEGSPADRAAGGGDAGLSAQARGGVRPPEERAQQRALGYLATELKEGEVASGGGELERIGYIGGDDAAAGGTETRFGHPTGVGGGGRRELADGASPDPAILATRLVMACAPSDLIGLQPQIALALGFDPGAPMEGGAQGRADELVRRFLSRLAPRQGETPRDMFFRYFGDHPFVSTLVDSRSTFGMDVDTASYNLVRAYLAKGLLPPKAAVRTEEFVNSFRHDLRPPPGDGAEVFAIHTELAPSPFGAEGTLLLRIGLKAREGRPETRRPLALTFVIDVSGSMAQEGRLELVKRALRMLVDQLDERDSIGIVTFSTDGRNVLDPVRVHRRAQILSTLDSLRPEGSTNADAGLRLGYDMALAQRREDAENRVILCSDGVANTGVTDVNRLVARIRGSRSQQIYLNCVGVGMGNHNDALLEQLADEGDGFCAYVDRDEEAREIFVEKLASTLTTVARDARIQVEFDPAAVRRFRQLGYENRALAHRDFRNDRVDAGEVGAGHEVIALYELELQPDAEGPLGTVRCRYQEPRSLEVIEQARALFAAEAAAAATDASPRFRLAMAVAEFAEILRQSIHARSASLADVQRFAEPLVALLPGDPDVPEFVALVQQAARLPDLLPRRSDLVRAVDEIKRVRCWQEELRAAEQARRDRGDPARAAADDDLLRQLEEQNRRLEEALRDALERCARGS